MSASPRPLTGFESQDIRTLIDAQAGRRSDHPFLIWEPFDGEARTWTYAEFGQAVRRFAAGLHARGVRPGDRVISHFDNCPQSLITWLGCAYAGAVPVTTNAKSSLDELSYFVEHSGAVAAITSAGFADLVGEALGGRGWMAVAGAERDDTPFEAVDAAPELLPQRPHDPLAPFGIQYTSGTTARPKAVLWTHANALYGASQCAMNEDLGPEDVHLVYLPLFHTNAQVYSVLASLWAGATVVLQPRFSASRFWPVSLKHGCTWTSMVPFCVRALLDHPVPERHAYRLWGSGACDLPTDARFGVKTLGWWGMTETIAHGAVGFVHQPNAPYSMGRPSAVYGIHVLDERGEPVSPGETGALLVRGVRGVTLFAEYFRDPVATAAAFREDGLFITGDRVRLGQDGWLYFSDRDKDMLKVGGENVAASEIERAVAATAGVQEVAVVGRRHPMLDEVPVAFVIAAPGAAPDLAEQVMARCRSSLAPFKVPHEIRLVEALPRATLDKVAKAELRKLLAAQRG